MANAFLEIDGQIVKKADGSTFPPTSVIAFIHNAIPHLFSNVKLTVGNVTVENLNHPGYMSSMLYNVIFPKSRGDTIGLDHCWVPDTQVAFDETKNLGYAARMKWIVQGPDTTGKFLLRLPLFMLFGFCENFLAMKGYAMEVELVRGADDVALLRKSNADQGKLKFNRIKLNIPVIEPSNAMLVEQLKDISEGKPYLFSFRARNCLMSPVPAGNFDYQLTFHTGAFQEKPVYVFLAFQKVQKSDQTTNAALFEHADVETVHVMMNNRRYPTLLTKADWKNHDEGFFYHMARHVRANYIQIDDRYIEGFHMTPDTFKTMYPIYCIDTSKGDFAVGGSSIVSTIHVRFKTATPANLLAYVGWISDKTISFNANGSPATVKMSSDSYK